MGIGGTSVKESLFSGRFHEQLKPAMSTEGLANDNVDNDYAH